MIQIRRAERKKAKLRLALCAPSGAGKTYSSLLIAFGLGGKIGLIDTENGSGDLYANLGEYDIITLAPPYSVAKYIQAINAFENAKYDTIIIDSLSHAWAGEGGLLDKQGKIADSGKGNSYTAWRTVTPEHNNLVETMLKSPCHIIATMRSKVEYVIEKNSNGKDTPKKVGMAPIQREGMDYEFTVCFDLEQSHFASASKDRTGLFDGQIFKPSKETGELLLGWLNFGADVRDYRNIADEIIQKLEFQKTLDDFLAYKEIARIDVEMMPLSLKAIVAKHAAEHEAKLRTKPDETLTDDADFLSGITKPTEA